MNEENSKIQSENDKTTSKKNPVVSELISWAVIIVSAIVIGLILNFFVIFKAEIPSGSMKDTLMIGDKVIGNRLSYVFGEPKRGDIIMFDYPDDETMLYIKRVIGLPGEHIEIRDGKIYINYSEEPLDEPYLREAPDPEDFGPYDVPEGCYFVLGDNRNESADARYWTNTYVKRDKIRCKAVFRFQPFSRIGFIK